MHNLTVLAFTNMTQLLEARDALINLQDEFGAVPSCNPA